MSCDQTDSTTTISFLSQQRNFFRKVCAENKELKAKKFRAY